MGRSAAVTAPWLSYAAQPYALPAPAKLNLFLHITGQDSNGYHRLQTLFVFIDWQDYLRVTVRHDGHIARRDLPQPHRSLHPTSAPLPEHDLCVRAARLLQRYSPNAQLGATLELEKNIPQEAGLGGGSSDAATTLIALNRLWGLHLDSTQLQRLGAEIGADVPFFLQSANAWAEGYGEQLHALPHLPAMHYAVIKPLQGVATRQLFLHPDLPRAKKHVTILGFARAADQAQRQFWALFPELTASNSHKGSPPNADFENVMQNLAAQICPDIAQALQALRNAGLTARMTGSGSAVFAPLPLRQESDQEDWRKAIEPHVAQGAQLRLCQGLTEHPLAAWIDA